MKFAEEVEKLPEAKAINETSRIERNPVRKSCGETKMFNNDSKNT